MFGRDRPAQIFDNIKDALTEDIPIREIAVAVCTFWLGDIIVNIAIAKMSKCDRAAPGNNAFYGGASDLKKLRDFINRNGDIMLNRPA